MPGSPSPDPAFVEPDPDLLRTFREECKLVGRLWRPKLGIQASTREPGLMVSVPHMGYVLCDACW